MVKRIISTLATVAMVMVTYNPARAEYLGTLQRNAEIFVIVQNASTDVAAVTVYYLDDRGIDRIEFMSVPAATSSMLGNGSQTFSKPGRGVRRVIIEVDVPGPGLALVTINGLPQIKVGVQDCTSECNPANYGVRFMFDVI